MRDPMRIDRIINQLRAKWYEHPDLRLTQLVSNIAGEPDPYYMEDDELEQKIKDY